MSKGQKIVTAALWGVLVIVMVGVIGAGAWDRMRPAKEPGAQSRSAPTTLRVEFDAPAFTLTNQDGKSVGSQDLRGHPWIAAFIFTRCPSVCPMMSSKMGFLQGAITDPRVKLVSFTIDPAYDTPEVLKTYAKVYHADPARWNFLTGTTEQMNEVARGMKISAQMGDTPATATHGTSFLLVDADGHVRGIYHGSDPKDVESLTRLVRDATELAGGKPQ
jgi:protein SCO1/2